MQQRPSLLVHYRKRQLPFMNTFMRNKLFFRRATRTLNDFITNSYHHVLEMFGTKSQKQLSDNQEQKQPVHKSKKIFLFPIQQTEVEQQKEANIGEKVMKEEVSKSTSDKEVQVYQFSNSQRAKSLLFSDTYFKVESESENSDQESRKRQQSLRELEGGAQYEEFHQISSSYMPSMKKRKINVEYSYDQPTEVDSRIEFIRVQTPETSQHFGDIYNKCLIDSNLVEQSEAERQKREQDKKLNQQSKEESLKKMQEVMSQPSKSEAVREIKDARRMMREMRRKERYSRQEIQKYKKQKLIEIKAKAKAEHRISNLQLDGFIKEFEKINRQDFKVKKQKQKVEKQSLPEEEPILAEKVTIPLVAVSNIKPLTPLEQVETEVKKVMSHPTQKNHPQETIRKSQNINAKEEPLTIKKETEDKNASQKSDQVNKYSLEESRRNFKNLFSSYNQNKQTTIFDLPSKTTKSAEQKSKPVQLLQVQTKPTVNVLPETVDKKQGEAEVKIDEKPKQTPRFNPFITKDPSTKPINLMEFIMQSKSTLKNPLFQTKATPQNQTTQVVNKGQSEGVECQAMTLAELNKNYLKRSASNNNSNQFGDAWSSSIANPLGQLPPKQQQPAPSEAVINFSSGNQMCYPRLSQTVPAAPKNNPFSGLPPTMTIPTNTQNINNPFSKGLNSGSAQGTSGYLEGFSTGQSYNIAYNNMPVPGMYTTNQVRVRSMFQNTPAKNQPQSLFSHNQTPLPQRVRQPRNRPNKYSRSTRIS